MGYGVKRRFFGGSYTQTPRIVEFCFKITQKACQGWIKYRVSFFESYFSMEKSLEVAYYRILINWTIFSQLANQVFLMYFEILSSIV